MYKDNLDQQIAIIGFSGRFPGAETVKDFWENLINGKETISFFSNDELLESGVDKELLNNSKYVKARGIIEKADHFDASFFGYTPREAELLDPQHRIFLECTWHALEDAGYNPFQSTLRTGIFGGVGVPWYLLEMFKNPSLQNHASGIAVITANDKDYLNTRISYKLNLTGTSVTVQSACSTSLVAIVMGMHSLLSFQNDMVLAGGVSITIPEKQGYLYEEGSLDSPDGHCRTFDAQARGTVFSSGAGVVVLKRLSDALQDRDNIYGIICGGAINNDGSTKVSYTAPSVKGQIAVEIEALEMAQINPETLSYIEAHGTATQLGDPIEIKALTDTFRQYTKKKQFCAIGSVKSNIGHTDAASGAIGLIKTSLMFKNQLIPQNLHFNTPNPEITFEESPFFVNSKLRKWEKSGNTPRRAMVNSFGVGGTNACVVVEEPPQISSERTERSNLLLLLSAKSEAALDQMTRNLRSHVESTMDLNLADMSYTLQVGRRMFDYRRSISFSSREDLLHTLHHLSPDKVFTTANSLVNRPLVFMFPGQGNQYIGMGSDLYSSEPLFKETVDECCNLLLKIGYEYDLRNVVFSSQGDSKLVDQTIIAQPSLFIIEYALAKLVMSWGLNPHTMIGHSIGEYVAACLSKVFSLEDALRIVSTRGKLIQILPQGSMLAIFATEEKVKKLIVDPLEISVVNSPNMTIVSGPTNEIISFEQLLQKENNKFKRLNTSHAFHSWMMDPIINPLEQIIGKAPLNTPSIPIISTVTGQLMTNKVATDPAYWSSHARKPVHFSAAIQELMREPSYLFLEVGPGHSLESAIKNHGTTSSSSVVGLMRAPTEVTSDREYLNNAIGKAWIFGGNILWSEYNRNEKRSRVSLPGYPFERQKFSIDFKQRSQVITDKKYKKTDIGQWFYFPSWKRSLLLGKDNLDALLETKFCWIIFGNRNPLEDSTIKFLRKYSQEIVYLYSGDSFSEIDDYNYIINPSKFNDYDIFFEKIKEKKGNPYRILHFWNVSDESFLDVSSIEKIEIFGFYSLLYIAQAIIKHNLQENLHLTVLGNNLFSIHNEKVFPEKALCIGPCRVIKNEYPMIQCKMIDVANESGSEFHSKQILSEALTLSEEIIVAYRNNHRWIPIFESIYIDSNLSPHRSFRKHGVYLITGGLGGIGLALAKYIASKEQVNLFLISRSSIPEKSQWEKWLSSHSLEDHISQKINKLQEIESLGSKVTIMHGDVADLSDMTQIVKQIIHSHEIIHGVFHCAGVPGGGVIPLKTQEMAADVLKPKVKGLLVLREVLKNIPVETYYLFSSITAILGEKAQIDYCAANSFLDAFAQYKNLEKPGSAISINWGIWDEVGMAVSPKLSNSSHELQVEKVELLTKDDLEELYFIPINPEQDWFINSHLLKGIPTLVGTAFFQFLSNLAKEKTESLAMTLRNIEFVSPLLLPTQTSKKLKLKLTKKVDCWDFVFQSHLLDGKTTRQVGQEHIKGEFSLLQGVLDDKIELSQLKNVMQAETSDEKLQHIQESNANSALFLGPRWQCVRNIYVGENEWLAELFLSQEFSYDFSLFSLHPAMLDVATTFCIPYIDDVLYLPQGYKKIIVLRPLEQGIYSYIKLRSRDQNNITLDIIVTNSQGTKLIQLEEYRLKKVSENSSQASSKPSQPKEFKNYDNILPHEGMEAFRRVFEQILSPQIVVYPSDFQTIIRDNLPNLKPEETIKSVGSLYPRPPLLTTYVAPTNEIEEGITRIWQYIFGIDGVGIDDNFIELGGNSLTAIQVIAQIADLFKIDFAIDVFYRNPTIRGISAFVTEQLLELLDEKDLEEVLQANE